MDGWMRPAVQTFQNDARSTPITGRRKFWDTHIHGVVGVEIEERQATHQKACQSIV